MSPRSASRAEEKAAMMKDDMTPGHDLSWRAAGLCSIRPKTPSKWGKVSKHPLLCGSASGITCLRRGKKNWAATCSQKRGVRRCERNNSADTKVREEGGAGGAPGAGAEIPL